MSYSRPDLPYLRALDERVLVFDGAMGTNIQLHHPTPEDFGGKSLEGCNDHLVLTRPDIIQAIHESFLEVGCGAHVAGERTAARRRHRPACLRPRKHRRGRPTSASVGRFILIPWLTRSCIS